MLTTHPTSHAAVSRDDWRLILTPKQFLVTRDFGTERAFTSVHNGVKASDGGVFVCAGCGQELFEARTKFDSGTGWPSFYDVVEGAVGMDRDDHLGYVR